MYFPSIKKIAHQVKLRECKQLNEVNQVQIDLALYVLFSFYIMMLSYVIVGFPSHVKQLLADTKTPGDESRENKQAYS